MQYWLEKARHFNELVMFKHSVFSLPFIFIAMVIAAKGWFGFSLLLLGTLAAITARNFAMGFNRYIDAAFDAKNPRTQQRPSVDGRLDKTSIILFTAINAIVFVLITALINATAFWLSFPVLALLASYSYFKRFSSSAHLMLGMTLAFAPLAGTIAVLGTTTLASWLLALGVLFWVAGFDLLYSLQDIDFDKEHGLHSIPSQYGANATMALSKLFHVQAVTFWALFSSAAEVGFFGWLAVVVSALFLLYEHHLVQKDFKQIDRAFFTVNGYLGFVYLFCIVLDAWMH